MYLVNLVNVQQLLAAQLQGRPTTESQHYWNAKGDICTHQNSIHG